MTTGNPPLALPGLEWPDITAALQQIGSPPETAARLAPDGTLTVVVPSVGTAMIFAAALAHRLTARNLACACCIDSECECDGERLGPATCRPSAADPVLELLARVSDSWEPVSAAGDELPALVLSFPGLTVTGPAGRAGAAVKRSTGQLPS